MSIDFNVLQAAEAQHIDRLFFSSSACIYPTHLMEKESKAVALSEDMIFPARADQMYGWAKLMTTLLCKEAPFDARVGILHTIYGEYQDCIGEQMKFPAAIAQKVLAAKKLGGPIEVWGNGKQIRTFLNIFDAIEKIYRIMVSNEDHTPVNVGSGRNVTLNEVAELCCEIVGIEPSFFYRDDKPSGGLARGCDNTKFETFYGYHDQISLRAGFERLIHWLRTSSLEENTWRIS